jgi:aldehyde dehydrogenase (NAD+)
MQIHQAPFFYKEDGFRPMTEPKDFPSLYIDGKWCAPENGRIYDVFNPATGARIGSAPDGDARDCEKAIAAARRAFDEGPWPKLSMRERYDVIIRLIDWLDAHDVMLSGMAVAEIGATIPSANGMHVAMTLDQMRQTAETALRFRPRMTEPTMTQLPPSMGGQKIFGNYLVLHEPVGVASLLGAYNAPLLLTGLKLVPALITGNTAIVKAPPQTPLETMIFAEAAEAAGIPAGVINFVSGSAIEIGQMLTSDPRVDLVSFTGSDVVGSKIMAQAASTVKRVFLELGGKSALIVRADADLDVAAAVGLSSLTVLAGQGCMLTTRQLIHESVYDQYVEKLVRLCGTLVLGDPSDPSVNFSPLISAAQRDRAESYVARAVAQGARVLFGGKRPAHLPDGFFFEPTVLEGVTNDWEICQEEVFGPVVVLMPFGDDDEAIRIANDTIYGLSGHIVSRDIGRAVELAGRIRSGEVYINGGSLAMSPFNPFGGTRRSGFGKQGGEEGLLEYMSSKAIIFKGA